jgi:hypothetical protein
VWEANSIAQFPLPRQSVSTHLNPLRYPRLTEVVKSIKEKISSNLDQFQAVATKQVLVRGLAATTHGLHLFTSDLLKDKKGQSILVNVLQLAKVSGWENSIGWGKRSSWFAEQFPGWFDMDQQGMFTR